MIKFVMCVTRHPDMSREEFKDYWMNKKCVKWGGHTLYHLLSEFGVTRGKSVCPANTFWAPFSFIQA
jgi:hypothetical protein